MSKPVRLAINLVESVLVLALVALIIMSTGWFQRLVERRVINTLENLTGSHVEIGYFRFRPWVFQITLQKLVIHGSESGDEPALIAARDVEAGLSPAQLLRQRLRLRFLDTEGVEVHIRTSRQGTTNLPVAGATPNQVLAGLMTLSIGRVSVSHAVLFWNNQRQALDFNSRDLAILITQEGGTYHGTLSSSATTIQVPEWSSPPIDFNSRFEASPTRVGFPVFAWKAPGTSGEASFSIRPAANFQASGSFHTVSETSFLGRVLKSPQLRSGDLELDGTAAYEGGVFSSRGQMQARKAMILVPGFSALPMNGTTNYTFENKQLSLTNFLVALWGGSVQGSLQADFQTSPAKFQLKSHIRQVRMEDALRAAAPSTQIITQLHPISIVGGSANATWTGRGDGLRAEFDLSFEAPASVPRNALPVSGEARGTLEHPDGFVLQLDDSRLATAHSTLLARGTLAEKSVPRPEAQPLALTASTDDLEELRPLIQSLASPATSIPLELKSRANFSGQLSGTVEAPSIQGRVDLGSFRYLGWEWDRLTTVLALNPRLVQISEGRIQRANSAFELNGSVQLNNWRLTPGSMIRVTADAQSTPIEGLTAVIGSSFPLRGNLTGHISAEGTTATLAGSGTVRIDSGAVDDESFDYFSAHLLIEKAAWKFQDIQFAKGPGRMNGDVNVEPARQFASGHLVARDFSIAEIRHLPFATVKTISNKELHGALSFDMRGQGTPGDFQLECPWRVQNLNVEGTSLGELAGTLKGEGNQLTLTANDQGAAGTLNFTAKATAEGPWPMTADGQYSNMRVDPWIRVFLGREFGAQVTAGGGFHAAGPVGSPQKIEFQSRVSELTIDFPSLEWRNAEPVDVHYVDGGLTFSRFVIRGPSTELAVDGSVELRQGGKVALNAEGTANATLLTIFDPKLQAAGRSTLHLRLSGTAGSPLLNGRMDIQNLSLAYSGLPFGLNDLQGTIQFEGERAVIASLRGTSGGGSVSMGGFITLAASPRYELTTDLRQVHIRYPAMFTTVFDGNLRLVGGADQAELLGDMVVHQMVFNENANFITKIIESAYAIGQPPVAVTSPSASKVQLDIRVTSNPSVQLQTPTARLAGDIDLRVQGTVANPVEVGSIHFLSGESVFRGNRYTLVRGDMDMTNPFRTQASLDVEVQTKVQNYNLLLDITGPFDRLKFSYRSDPPLAQTDIISLLALGYVPQEQTLPTLQGNPSSSIGASAILSEALSTQLGGRIQHLFGVSRIKIDPDVGMPGLNSGERVTVEEQLTHDLTLTYITDTAYSQYTIIQFELNLGNNMSVLGVRDPNGVFGIEFRFHLQFK